MGRGGEVSGLGPPPSHVAFFLYFSLSSHREDRLRGIEAQNAPPSE